MLSADMNNCTIL